MIAVLKRFFPDASKLSKVRLFYVILAAAFLVAIVVAIGFYVFTVKESKLPPLHIALVAPLSGDHADLGTAMLDGMTLKAVDINRAGGIGGRELSILTFDDANDPEQAKKAAAAAVASGAVAVIGHTHLATLTPAEPLYAAGKMGVITLASDQSQRTPLPEATASRLLVAEDYEARFLANYLRNVVGEKTVHILYEDSPRGEALANAFDETMQRFGTKVVYRWPVTPDSPNLATQVTVAAQQLNEGKLPGTILILADATTSARTLIRLRLTGLHNPIACTRSCATDLFINTLRKEWNGPSSLEAALNGTLLASPMLFDVAGEGAQNFRTDFIGRFRHSPDWVAAYANDAVQSVVSALQIGIGAGDATDESLQAHLFQQLSGTSPAAAKPAQGINGPVLLNPKDRELSPPLIGVFNGVDLISTTTQLIPIREEGLSNLLQQFMEGRAIYVNDRFMYRTNVVYTGIQPISVSSFDDRGKVVEGDFLIWFRWRGDFEPQDIVFSNAVKPIRLDKPDHEDKTQDITYRAYRVHGKFYMNFTSAPRAFDTLIMGVSFHHRLLSRHNVMYVTDILGMGMTRDTTLHTLLQASNAAAAATKSKGEGISALLLKPLFAISQFLHSGTDRADPMVNILTRTNVLNGVSGWVIDRAWISQDIVPRSSEGDPNYVGFGRPAPDFSHIELGILLKPDLIRARDIIPSKDFWYVAIFSGIGALLAFFLDRKYGRSFWRVQTFFLRLVCWPLFLGSFGNLVLDKTVQYASAGIADIVWTTYNVATWLLPALLIVIAMDRFLWIPLEERTKRKVPGIMRLLAASVVFVAAIFGVVSYVFEGSVTGLLATTGLSAMIIGIAVKDNIANVLSGIILNVEKPFAIGDKVRLSIARGAPLTGKVVDITWRATQIEHEQGHIVTIPNGKLSESEVHNLSTTRSGFLCDLKVSVDPALDQDKVVKFIKGAIADNPHVMLRGDTPPAAVTLLGLQMVGEAQMAVYRVRTYVKGSPDGKPVCTKVGAVFWDKLIKSFQKEGFGWGQVKPILPESRCAEETA